MAANETGEEVNHLAPAIVGARLRSHARLTRRGGRLFWLEEGSEDPAVAVGRGWLIRTILDGAAIEARAATRISTEGG